MTRHDVITVRFNCDAWYYKGGNEWEPVDCPNTLRLTGTEDEIEEYYLKSKWTYKGVQHVCPRIHYIDSLGLRKRLEPKRIGLYDGLPVYEDPNLSGSHMSGIMTPEPVVPGHEGE